MIRLNPCIARIIDTIDVNSEPRDTIDSFEISGNVSIVKVIFSNIFVTDKSYYEIMYLRIICPLLSTSKNTKTNDYSKKIIARINTEIEQMSDSTSEKRD